MRGSGPDRYLVLGDPVEHSLSPVMHNGAMAALGLAATYERRRVDDAGMVRASEEMRRGDLSGANITMPHKRLAAELADRVSPEAGRARSVNTWVMVEGTIEGHSTDVVGVRRVVHEQCLPGDGPVVVLGTGGAAAATAIALADRPLTIMARRQAAGMDLVAECGVMAEVRDWTEHPPAGLVVNCTPIGMAGDAMPERMIEYATGYLEMVYAHGETSAEKAVRARGLPVAGGVHLLASQAEASFEMWFGVAPPSGLMYGLAYKYLKERQKRVES